MRYNGDTKVETDCNEQCQRVDRCDRRDTDYHNIIYSPLVASLVRR